MKAVEILCTNIRRVRLARGLSQEAVAELTGLSPRHFQDIEAMRREGIRLATIEKVARVLRVPVWQLLQADRFPEAERQRGKTGTRIKR